LLTVLSTQLKSGDRLTDSTGEWEVIGRPYSTAGGKNSHVRVQRVDSPAVTETRDEYGELLGDRRRTRAAENRQTCHPTIGADWDAYEGV